MINSVKHYFSLLTNRYINDIFTGDSMEGIKAFINNRSKIGFIVFLISILLGVLLVEEFMDISKCIKLMSDSNYNKFIAYNNIEILRVVFPNDLQYISLFVYSLLIFILLFNMVSYIYKKSEFMFISTGLSIFLLCFGFYTFSISGIIFCGCLFILNLIGFLDQTSVQRGTKKNEKVLAKH